MIKKILAIQDTVFYSRVLTSVSALMEANFAMFLTSPFEKLLSPPVKYI